MGFLERLRYNVKRVKTVDPAATSTAMVLLTYPHIRALCWHYLAHKLYVKGYDLLARWIAYQGRKSGIEIHPGAIIGKGLFIDHGTGVVIGETAIIGDDVTLFHGVTLGGMSTNRVKRHPTLEDNVLVGAGTKILGDVIVGENTKIGCNLVLKKDIPANTVIFEISPHEIHIRREGKLEKEEIVEYNQFYVRNSYKK